MSKETSIGRIWQDGGRDELQCSLDPLICSSDGCFLLIWLDTEGHHWVCAVLMDLPTQEGQPLGKGFPAIRNWSVLP